MLFTVIWRGISREEPHGQRKDTRAALHGLFVLNLSVVGLPLMTRSVVRSIPRHGPIRQFLVEPVFHNWCSKCRSMCYPVWDGIYKISLTTNRKV